MDSVQRQTWHEELTFILFCLFGQENIAGQIVSVWCLCLIPHSNKTWATINVLTTVYETSLFLSSQLEFWCVVLVQNEGRGWIGREGERTSRSCELNGEDKINDCLRDWAGVKLDWSNFTRKLPSPVSPACDPVRSFILWWKKGEILWFSLGRGLCDMTMLWYPVRLV